VILVTNKQQLAKITKPTIEAKDQLKRKKVIRGLPLLGGGVVLDAVLLPGSIEPQYDAANQTNQPPAAVSQQPINNPSKAPTKEKHQGGPPAEPAAEVELP